jgi:hypothetical protein
MSDYPSPDNPGPYRPLPCTNPLPPDLEKGYGRNFRMDRDRDVSAIPTPPNLRPWTCYTCPLSRCRCVSQCSKAKAEKKSASATRTATTASPRLCTEAESLSEAPPVGQMEASTQDKIVDLSPAITLAVRLKSKQIELLNLKNCMPIRTLSTPSLLTNDLRLPPTAPTSSIQPNIMQLLRKSEPQKEKNSRNYLPFPSPLHLIYPPPPPPRA